LLEEQQHPGDDVVAVHQEPANRLAVCRDVDRGRGTKATMKADGGSRRGGIHQHTEPTTITAVVGGW